MSENDVPAINYTSRDFLTIKEALKQHLKVKFPNTWRDFYESNAGIAILDLIAYSHDVLSFFVDYTANELYVSTARDRLSLLNLGRLVGYQLRTATSASVVCSTSIANIYAEAVIVPAGTILTSTTGVNFVTVEDARIEAGQVTGEIVFVEGVNRENNFTSDGTSFQKVTLLETPVIQDTVSILVDGDEWAEVASLAYAEANDDVFSVTYDENAVATVTFGDGVSGRTPPVGVVVTVAYRTGGGISGNVGLNTLVGTAQGQRELILPVSNVTVTVINDEERGSGGEDPETVSHAKLWIPAWVSANGRAVTEADYDALANAFSDPVSGAPAFVKAKLKQEIPELNTVELYVWGRDAGGDVVEPSTGLKTALDTYFNNQDAGSVRMICTHTEVLDGAIVYIDLRLSIRIVSSYTQADVIASVQQAVDDLFESDELRPGADFRISALYDAVFSLAGVSYCLVDLMQATLKRTELVGVGDGVNDSFGITLDLDSGLEVVPLTVQMYYGALTEILTDDGDGNIINSLSVVVGSIDYETGVILATFAAAPPSGSLVYAEYRHTIDYQRGSVEGTGDGVTQRYQGGVTYPPVNPFNPVSHVKGIAFSDGTQVIVDDGDGNLSGDIDPTGQNVIDYGTGGYDMTFLSPPPLDAEIWSAYRQILQTNSEDIPIDKSQMAVKGFVTISVISSD